MTGPSQHEQRQQTDALWPPDGEALLRAVTDILPVGVLVLAGDSVETATVVHVNAAFAEIAGVNPEPAILRSALARSIYLPDRSAPLPLGELPGVRAMVRGASIRDTEVHIRRPDGTWRVALASASPLQTREHRVGAVVSLHDITERKRAEEEREFLLRDTGRLAKVGGWEFDVATGEGTWTEEVARIHGLDPEQATNAQRGMGFFGGEHRARIEQAVAEAVELGRPYDLELELVTAGGERKWVRTIGYPHFENGKVTRLRGSMQDITERKRGELEREVTVRFLHLLNESLSIRDLVQRATGFIQEQSGCEAVGIRLREGDDYPYFETRGFPQEFVLAESSLCARDDRGELLRDDQGSPLLSCMCGNVIRGRVDPAQPFFTAGGSFWTNNTTRLLASTTEADRQGRTRDRCNGEGYESVALVPLHVAGERLGLIQMNDRREGRFTAEGIALWERLAGYLAAALAKLRAEESRRLSERRLRAVIDNAKSIIWLKDLEGRYIVVNRCVAQTLGRPPEELLGRTAAEVFGSDAAELFTAHDRQVLAAGEAMEFEELVPVADGERSYIAVKFPLCDLEGRIYALGAICTDITERKRAEQAVRDRESMLRLVMDATPALISYVDADLRYRRVNKSYERWFGMRADEIEGRTVPEVLGDAAWQAARTHVERALAGEGVSFETEMAFRAGGARWADHTFTPDIDAAGNVRGYVVHVVDTTERKRAEDARARLAAIVDATPDLVSVADADGNVLTLNPAGREMMGVGEGEDLSGMEIWSFCTPSTRELIANEAIPIAVRDGSWSGETVLLSRDGREVPMSQVVIARKGPGGGVEFLATVARDIRRWKELEGELRQAQKMEAVGRLAGGVAHDFNNLLLPIMSYSEMLCEAVEPHSKLHRWAVAIATQARRAAGLSRQLLAFSRKQIIQPQVIDLSGIVAGVERMLRRLIGEDILLTVPPRVAPGKVKADPGQIEQVLLNLVVNARDAMPDGGRLSIETVNAELTAANAAPHLGIAPGRYVVLAVSDTGCGMDQETLSHIFEPFFTTKELGKGTGLGLSTVYGIVTQSHGQIRVSSEPGKGTTFRVYLPRVDEEEPAAEPSAAGAPQGTEVVLLVEDDDAVREATEAVLESQGYAIITAPHGEAGLQAAQRHAGPIHLLLTDVVMPKMSGRQLADRLVGERPGLRVLFMSGYTDDAIVHHGVLDEGIAFLQKPFAPGDLLRKVREVLDRPALSSSSPDARSTGA